MNKLPNSNIIIFLAIILCATLHPLHLCAQDAILEKADALYKNQSYFEANKLYKQFIAVQPKDKDDAQEFVDHANSLSQILYGYILTGRNQEAVEYFTQIKKEQKLWIVRQSPRDIDICIGYALYLTGAFAEAKNYIDKAFAHSISERNEDLLYMDYGIASVIYNQTGEIEKAIDCNLRCIEILRQKETSVKSDGRIISALGNLIYQYQQIGQLEKSLATYEELLATEGYDEHPYAMCCAEINVVELYQEWGIEEEVDKHLNKALVLARASDIKEGMPRTFNMYIVQNLRTGHYDQAASYIDNLNYYVTQQKDLNFYVDMLKIYELTLSIYNKPTQGISFTNKEAVEKLTQDIRAKEQLGNIDVLKARMLGDALILKEEKRLAINLLETVAEYLEDHSLLNSRQHILGALAELYADLGENQERSVYLYRVADEAKEMFIERRNAQILTAFRVEKEVDKLRKKSSKTALHWGITLSFFIILASLLIYWIVRRYWSLSSRHEETQTINETLHQELDKANMKRSVQDLINQTPLEGEAPSALLVKENVLDFRNRFVRLYPEFIYNLREHQPHITNGEELLAILISLNLTNEEIAKALGNSSASIRTSRARLKSKLNLPKDQNLGKFLNKIR